ncbi:cytosolic purine 5'-nucleotidase-like isoform X7 [Camellia sinensis]|uniref:cytosolic purine 5'-nucleotidase-like isoform X7 n=1 Tax=Camellia sinensis TaxID=4442 RepID=UPI001035BFB9|nr:cytosolic purine 5'-nucleotidase-like isoform X7 [Camellia sinensis]
MLPRLVRVCPKTPKHKNWLSNTGLKLLWDYTNIVMNFLCGPQTSDSCSTLNFEWLRFFNVVTTGSAKQSLFHDENRANLFEVEPASRMLLNTDNGTPMPQVGGALRLPLKSLNKSCKVFQVLYVGDHIYGDILRSKKVLGVAGWGVGGIEAEAIMLGQTCMKWVAVFSSFSKGAKENAASASPKPAAAGNSNCNVRNFLERCKIWSKN